VGPGAVPARGCENPRVPALPHLNRWGFAAALAAASATFGVIAGIDPRFAIAGSLSFGFLLLVLADLYVGLILFTLVNFAAQVPTVAGPTLSFAKIAGLLLAISWVAALATRHDTRSDFTSAHPGLTYVLVLFLSWSAVSQVWAEDSGAALTAFSRLALDAMLFLIIFTAIRTPTQAIGFVGAFVGGACIDGLYGVLFAPSSAATASRLSSSITNPNELASILVAALVLSFGLAAALRRQPLARGGALAAAALCTGGIFLTGSRGGLVALAVALAAFLIVGARWRGRLLAVVVVVALAGVGYFNYVASPAIRSHVSSVGSGTGRLDLWTVAWRMVEQEPIRGVGAGNFPVSSVHYLLEPGAIQRSDYIVGSPKVAHNTYLELWAELGLVGLMMFVCVVGFCLYSALKAAGSFARQGDAQMEVIARALFVALAGLLAADFFGSRLTNKEVWLLLGLGPALLAIARSRERPASP
jgi:O-antigen ligase